MFEQLTIKDIDQEWAWSQLVGRMISVGKKHKYCSPLRSDNSPGVWFEYHNDILLIIDFGDKPNSHINCVTAWSRIKGIHWRKALREIYERQGVRVKREVKEKVKEKEECIIEVTPCWNKEHTAYWKKRFLKKPLNVEGVCAFTISKSGRTRTYLCADIVFAYTCNEKIKLYFPERTKSKRFLGNQTKNDLWFFDKGSNVLIVSKSHKDALVINDNCEFNVTHIQGENYGHPDRYVLDQWIEKHDVIILWMDADRAGKEGAERLKKLINSDKVFLIYTPSDIDCKDADDVLVKYGKKFLSELINTLVNSF